MVHEEVLPDDEADCPTQFYAFLRKDVDLVIRELIASPEVCGAMLSMLSPCMTHA